MRYFRKSPTEVYGYDESQADLASLAIQNGWEEITGAWPPPPEPPSLPEQFELVRQALQGAIDDKAYELGQFSSGDALIQYAGFTNAFQPLAQQFGAWEVSVWLQADAYRQEVVAGTKPMVTPEQAVALMPAYPT